MTTNKITHCINCITQPLTKDQNKFCSRKCRSEFCLNHWQDRFWRFVTKTDTCWIWAGAKSDKRYGFFKIQNKMLKAHRLSYELHKGDIPEGVLVCHSCDNPPCVNPDHLFLGTHKTNAEDRMQKGRHGDRYRGMKALAIGLETLRQHPEKYAHGERGGFAKLTNGRVREMRELYAQGLHSQKEIAKLFDISHAQANKIINRKTWKYVD